ncbi:macrophage mannose receptor 1 isoform X2 [Kryptolebias marmoratus]|nr:macrophage mannose receptor 1 isoform X2 [Kryptolebias marmoratus]
MVQSSDWIWSFRCVRNSSVMKRRGLVFLLLLISGCLLLRDVRSEYTVRRFKYMSLMKTWNEAQSYCREEFSDLATIQNSDNITEAKQVAGIPKVWIGLFNGSWKWSQEENQDISSSIWYQNWYLNEPQEDNCVMFRNDGFWFTKDCGNQYKFVCYNALLGAHVLVEQEMTWSDAQAYCRSQYTDLSSIKNGIDNGFVFSAIFLKASPVWIGLHRSTWVWSDNSSVSFRAWGFQLKTETGDCVLMDLLSGTWLWKPCSEEHYFLCQIDIRPSVKRSVKIRLSPGSADLNDPAVQESILQQLQMEIPEDVKLRWKTQPDGKIFQKESETAPPAACDQCDTV